VHFDPLMDEDTLEQIAYLHTRNKDVDDHVMSVTGKLIFTFSSTFYPRYFDHWVIISEFTRQEFLHDKKN
jgi:hypothetical protein